jgi:hypothetical protein
MSFTQLRQLLPVLHHSVGGHREEREDVQVRQLPVEQVQDGGQGSILQNSISAENFLE